ncbi:hypothetical protein OC842_004920 [Tilletia horrida]|uniref:VWFA domain-containing protein n=1 Tax=Tilletia horrida TaxID=155126 RepID=A0AAN6GA43_9BASI|nr:hypothetical protein OC842_004920 [Tilletia horrida]
MTFNKKLLVAGLAVGVTSLLLYELSKKKKEKSEAEAVAASSSSSGHAGQFAAAAGGAALAGAGIAAYNHHHNQQAAAHFPANPADFTWDNLRDPNFITKLLSDCVIDQYLYSFYSFKDVQHIAQRVAGSGALAAVADAWRLPPSLAADLVKLALFDVFFLLDDSASMRSEGTLRRDALKSIVKLAAEAATRFDTDGVELNWLNNHAHAIAHTAEDATRFVGQCNYDGRATPMGTSLEGKILEKEVYPKLKRETLRKPVLIVVVGDGSPTGESPDKFRKEIKEAKKKTKKSRYGEDAVSFQVAVVGNDSGAREWLEELDADKDVGDLVDVCSDIRTESAQVKRVTGVELSEELWALKIMMGSIDSSYDASDESHSSKAAKRKEERAKKDAHYAKERARFMQDRNAALGHYLAAASTGGFSNASAQSTQAQSHQRVPSASGQGMGAAYPPAGPSGGAGSSPYPPPSGGSGYPPAQPGAGYPPPSAPQSGGYPPAQPGGPQGYPPPVSAYGGGGGGDGGYPPFGGAAPGGYGGYPPPMGGPPAYTRGIDSAGGPGAGPGSGPDNGFTSGVGGFMMPTPSFGGGAAPGGSNSPYPPPQGGGPGFPQGPSFPSQY